MRAVIVDDEPKARNLLRVLLKENCPKIEDIYMASFLMNYPEAELREILMIKTEVKLNSGTLLSLKKPSLRILNKPSFELNTALSLKIDIPVILNEGIPSCFVSVLNCFVSVSRNCMALSETIQILLPSLLIFVI